MTASINTAYPIAGQDNDSQGFRDNFSNISNLFVEASKEIGDLQVNAARTDIAEVSYNSNVLSNTVLKANGKLINTIGSPATGVRGSQTVDIASANYHKVWVHDVTTISASWLTGSAHANTNQTMRIEVQLSADSTQTATVNFVGTPNPWQPQGGGRTIFPYAVNGTPAVWEWTYTPNDTGNSMLTFIGQYTA
jgi:hypothetical protein